MKRSKLLPYSEIATRTLVNKSSTLMGLSLMVGLGIVLGLYLHMKDLSVNIFLETLKNTANDQLNVSSIKTVCFIIIFLLFGTISGLMQSIISDKDTNVIKQIGPMITENDYILGKLVAAFFLLVTSLVNSLIGVLIAIFTNDFLQGQNVTTSFGYLSQLFSGGNIKLLIYFTFIICMEFITLSMFTLVLAGRINKIQEAASNTLLVLSPIFISIFLLILPSHLNIITNLTSIAMFIPLISTVFDFVSLAINGFNFQFCIGIVLSFIYMIMLYKINIKLYQYFLYSEKKFSISEVIKLLYRKQ